MIIAKQRAMGANLYPCNDKVGDGSHILHQLQLHTNYFISTPALIGPMMGVYRFYENWSTESFVKKK